MAVTQFKTYMAGEVLTASDLNSSLLRITDNGEDLGWPATKAKDLDGNELILDSDGDTSITADTDDQVDLKIGGTDEYTFTASAMDIQANELILDADADTSITADTDDQIDFKIGGTDRYQMTASGLDVNGNPIILDADGDSNIRETSDDVVALRLQGFDAFIFDGDIGSPVNGLTLGSRATTGSPQIAAHGSDDNVNIHLLPKGSGQILLGSNFARMFDLDYYQNSADQSISDATTETDITTLTAITLPNTTATLTSRYFLIRFTIAFTVTNSGNELQWRLYSGSNGTKADTLVYEVNYRSGITSLNASISGEFRLNPASASDTKIGLAVVGNNATALTVYGTSPNFSTLSVVEVLA